MSWSQNRWYAREWRSTPYHVAEPWRSDTWHDREADDGRCWPWAHTDGCYSWYDDHTAGHGVSRWSDTVGGSDDVIEPDPEWTGSVGESQPKPKAKANAKADPDVRMYPDEAVTEVYYDETMTQIVRQTIHSNRWCGEMQTENARRLRICRWCQSRGQLYHGRPCAGSKVYFTPFGTCYHTSEGCHGLAQRNTDYNVMHGIGCSECMMVPYDEL